jgi:hypothetical protein
MFLSEISSDDIGGMACGTQEVIGGVGTLIAYLISLKMPTKDPKTNMYDTNDNWWRYCLFFHFILALLRVIALSVFFKIESPPQPLSSWSRA